MGNVFEVCINFLQTKLSHTDFGIPPNVFGILRKANVYFFSLSLSLSFFKMCASIFQSGADFFFFLFLKSNMSYKQLQKDHKTSTEILDTIDLISTPKGENFFLYVSDIWQFNS